MTPIQRPLRLFFVLVSLLCFAACADDQPGDGLMTKPPQDTRSNEEPGTTDCTDNIKAFLSWYQQAHERIGAISLVAMDPADTSSCYRVQFDSVAVYQAALRASGYFSERMLQDQLAYFRQVDEGMARTRQQDGPPEGLEYDLLLYTQEDNELLSQLQAVKVKRSGADRYLVRTAVNELVVEMRAEQGKCRIDQIRPKL